MIQTTLTKRLPIPSGFVYPARTSFVQALSPGLVTGANVLVLLATEPWLGLRRNRLTPLTLDHKLHRRPNNPLWRIAVSYAGLEEDNLIAYWELTHYLESTKAMLASDPDRFIYHQDRRQRRIRVGDCWRKLLGTCLPIMRTQWADIDLLLNPYFLHLPTPQDRPTDLITALFGCDQVDPGRNHFCDPGTAHPSLQIPRLANNFNPPAALLFVDRTSLRENPP
ncbi:hypothetical protein PHMEG_00012606 [Phytophthora megakarya]|uniref:Uncharacterized protein n=1 Tax=Phytophthora megakarya TaxID=4795 RepID=A0A225W9A8_9STRA|nr:hypothetical protein PHMEG_00012606 [Phytophthora megakarya]